MRTTRAIETVYNGYRFRSRLEAKWAIFFEALNIKYEYETEGFHLPSGNYLPDFWLPEWEVWFEIKGRKPDAHEKQLAQELCEHTGYITCIANGVPESTYSGIAFAYMQADDDTTEGQEWGGLASSAEIKLESRPFVITHYPDGNQHAWLVLQEWDWFFIYKKEDGRFKQYPCPPVLQAYGDEEYVEYALSREFMEYRVIPAINKAKSARFEHGESPT